MSVEIRPTDMRIALEIEDLGEVAVLDIPTVSLLYSQCCCRATSNCTKAYLQW